MKKYLMAGMSALALCSTFMSCSHDDIVTHSGKINIIETYDRAFIERFGPVSPDQDWGFGVAATNESTRAAFTNKWTDNHKCDWESKLNFTKATELTPDAAVDVTQPNFDKNRGVYYVPESFNGELDLQWLGFNTGDKFYNYGTITAINNVNYNGTITFYNAGTITNFGPSSGGRHTVVNTGSLTVCGYANIGDLYNGGTLVLEREHNPYWPNEGGKLGTVDHDISIYSTGEKAIIMMPDGGGHLDAKLDVHNKIYVEGDIEFQNDDQTRYVCELEVTGKLYLNKGALYVASIKADEIEFNAFPLYLRQGAHVVANHISMDPSGSYVYGHTNSVALIEAGSFYFKNKNDLTHNFSDNIYFKVSDYIQIEGCYKNAHSDGSGQDHYYTNMDEYLANTEDEYNLVAGRLNAGNAAGSPACGAAWAIGTEPLPEDPKDSESKYSPAIRILAEDLTTSERGDFDFNDVVFDVEWLDNGNTRIILRAAGGTLPMTVGNYHNGSETDEYQYEVHHMFGLSNTNQMISTVNTGSPLLIVLPVVSYELSGNFGHDANKIPVMVKKMGEWIELEAIKGKAPKKIAVTGSSPRDFMWCDERQSIEEKYGEFIDWVSNPSVEWY